MLSPKAAGDGDNDLYVVSGGSEHPGGHESYQDRLYINDGKGNLTKSPDALPILASGGAAVDIGDIDKDGDNDIIVGGGVMSNGYPNGFPVNVLINEGGKFTDKSTSMLPDLQAPKGVIKDLYLSDVNNDDYPDLFVIGEWMSVSLYLNENGNFRNATAESGLAETSGWWNTIAGGDFDGDGDNDYVVGNLGLNSRIKASKEEPATIYAKDFDSNGSYDAVLCSYVLGKNYPIHTRDEIFDQMPYLKPKFLRYADYASADINGVFTEAELQDALILESTMLETVYLENDGSGKFSIRPLPKMVQISPVNDILVDDFNGDSKLDLLMVGNNYDVDAEIGNYDASVGWYLEGDGQGEFRVVPSRESGFMVKGNAKKIRKLRVGDENWLVIAKNSEPVQVVKINSPGIIQ